MAAYAASAGMEYVPTSLADQRAILCAECGIVIEPNGANLCVGCLRNSVDITEGIPKESSLTFCRACERWAAPPNAWVHADAESRELLSLCLKKIAKPLSRVRLIDASFLWTEPHSRRLKLKLVIQKEVLTGTVLQQTFVLTLVVQGGQCPSCQKLAAKNTWKASVQLRQKVNHKRTFLFLEQLILKHGAHKDTISINEKRDGLDFFYSERNSAIKMVEFLAGVVPIRSKGSEQLLSSDTHSNTSNYKFTYSVEIIPICKDDLVCIPKSMAKGWGNISPLTICSRIGNSMHLLDPTTLQHTDVSAQVYWRNPFDSLATISDLVEFVVLDIEPSGPVRGKWVLADAQVTRASGTGTGTNGDDDGMGGSDGIFHTRTHLGAILQPGDTVLGFQLTNSNFNNDAFTSLDPDKIPDVVLVKKTYPNRRRKAKARNWKLKSIAKEAEDQAEVTGAAGRGALGRRGGLDSKRVEKDYELFLRDLEEDPELRAAINLYKAPVPVKPDAIDKHRKPTEPVDQDGDEDMDDDREDLAADTDIDEDEEDFPDVGVDELLEHFEELDIQAAEQAREEE